MMDVVGGVILCVSGNIEFFILVFFFFFKEKAANGISAFFVGPGM